jgi:hypothetical protein
MAQVSGSSTPLTSRKRLLVSDFGASSLSEETEVESRLFCTTRGRDFATSTVRKCGSPLLRGVGTGGTRLGRPTHCPSPRGCGSSAGDTGSARPLRTTAARNRVLPFSLALLQVGSEGKGRPRPRKAPRARTVRSRRNVERIPCFFVRARADLRKARVKAESAAPTAELRRKSRGTCEGSLGLLPPGSDPVRNLAAPRAHLV